MQSDKQLRSMIDQDAMLTKNEIPVTRITNINRALAFA
jgi:hypothetical protein